MTIQAIGSNSLATSEMMSLAREKAASSGVSTGKSSAAAPAKPAGGPPPGGGAAPATDTASTSSTSSTTSDAKIYDKRDTNKDGTVSYMEQMAYDSRYTMDQMQDKTGVSNNQLQTGLGAYQQAQQAYGSTTSLSTAA